MSKIAVGNGGGRGGAATAITIALILMASPAILITDAFAAPISNEDCKDIQFRRIGIVSLFDESRQHNNNRDFAGGVLCENGLLQRQRR